MEVRSLNPSSTEPAEVTGYLYNSHFDKLSDHAKSFSNRLIPHSTRILHVTKILGLSGVSVYPFKV